MISSVVLSAGIYSRQKTRIFRDKRVLLKKYGKTVADRVRYCFKRPCETCEFTTLMLLTRNFDLRKHWRCSCICVGKVNARGFYKNVWNEPCEKGEIKRDWAREIVLFRKKEISNNIKQHLDTLQNVRKTSFITDVIAYSIGTLLNYTLYLTDSLFYNCQ